MGKRLFAAVRSLQKCFSQRPQRQSLRVLMFLGQTAGNRGYRALPTSDIANFVGLDSVVASGDFKTLVVCVAIRLTPEEVAAQTFPRSGPDPFPAKIECFLHRLK
jgi:hypothetical protein